MSLYQHVDSIMLNGNVLPIVQGLMVWDDCKGLVYS